MKMESTFTRTRMEPLTEEMESVMDSSDGVSIPRDQQGRARGGRGPCEYQKRDCSFTASPPHLVCGRLATVKHSHPGEV